MGNSVFLKIKNKYVNLNQVVSLSIKELGIDQSMVILKWELTNGKVLTEEYNKNDWQDKERKLKALLHFLDID